MDTFVFIAVAIDTIGLVAIVLGLELASFFPHRQHQTRPWVWADEAKPSRAA